MKTVNSRQAIEAIANKEEFKNTTGSFRGVWVNSLSDLPYRNDESDLGVAIKDMLDDSFLGFKQDCYVVTSYDVPIAFLSGRTYQVTQRKWSVTTSKHTGIAQQGFSR